MSRQRSSSWSSASSLDESPCLICYENSSVDWVAIQPCEHGFCRDCLVEYTKDKIVSSKERLLYCPSFRCDVELDRSRVSDLIADDKGTQDALRRLDQLHDNPSLLPCPGCSELMDQPARLGNALQCPSCQCNFCRVHGQAHTGLTCKQYFKTPDYHQQAESERIILRHSIPCSRCGARLQKADGCDYVICGHCNGDICYFCRTHRYLYGDPQTHSRRCRRCLTAEDGDPGLCTCVCFFVAIFAYSIVWLLFAAIAVIATGCCCCCFFGGSWGIPRENVNERFDWDRGMSSILVILFWPLASWALEEEDEYDLYIPAFLPFRRSVEIPAVVLTTSETNDSPHQSRTEEEDVTSSHFDEESQLQEITKSRLADEQSNADKL